MAYNGLNSNPGGNRHAGNKGRSVSVIGFANNGYENYVYQGHMGGVFDNTNMTLPPGAQNNTVNYQSLNGIELNTGSVTTLNADGTVVANVVGAFVNQVLSSNRTRTTSFNNDTDANHWAIALTGSHAFTDDISMHYGLAYLALNKPNYRVAKSAAYDDGLDTWTIGGYNTQDKDLGFEVDLGFTFQLLDNLSFTSAFGYMFNGDAYKSLKGYKVTDASTGQTAIDNGTGRNIKAVWEGADDSYVWFNSVTLSF